MLDTLLNPGVILTTDVEELITWKMEDNELNSNWLTLLGCGAAPLILYTGAVSTKSDIWKLSAAVEASEPKTQLTSGLSKISITKPPIPFLDKSISFPLWRTPQYKGAEKVFPPWVFPDPAATKWRAKSGVSRWSPSWYNPVWISSPLWRLEITEGTIRE